MLENNPLLIFVHIPKTGGLTIKSILYKKFGEERIFPTTWSPNLKNPDARAFGIFAGRRKRSGGVWYSEQSRNAARRFNDLSDEQQERVNLIYGFHVEFGIHEYLSRECTYFTMLRHPVERVLSHYFYTVDGDVPADNDLYNHISSMIEDNLQTKILSGPHGEHPLPVNAEMLECAKDNLRTRTLVGLTERFDESILLLSKVLHWQTPLYRKVNVNKKRPARRSIPAAVLERIEADNHMDMELYKYAKELFEVQAADYGPGLFSDLKGYESRKRLWGNVMKIKHIPRKVIYDPYNALAHKGWVIRQLPDNLQPQLFVEPMDGKIKLDLRISSRAIASYHIEARKWLVRPRYKLLVDESILPRISTSPEGMYMISNQHGASGLVSELDLSDKHVLSNLFSGHSYPLFIKQRIRFRIPASVIIMKGKGRNFLVDYQRRIRVQISEFAAELWPLLKNNEELGICIQQITQDYNLYTDTFKWGLIEEIAWVVQRGLAVVSPE